MGGITKQTNVSNTQPKHHWLWQRHRRVWRLFGGIFIGVVVIAVGIFIAFQVSPWPGSLLIRYEFTQGAERTSQAVQKYVPADIASIENQEYQANNSNGFLDVFYPKNSAGALPTVVWVHGGGWVSGDKNDIDNYLKVLAGRGFTTIGVDYTIAPEAQYPKPLHEVNDALGYIQQNAERLHIDPNYIILAGDSAGSQIVAQMANIVTSPSYATETGVQPKLTAERLRGVLLNCGAYDLKLPDYNGPFGNFLHTVLWAYSGTKDFLNDPKLQTASVVNYVTPQFPPAFITAGNIDPLLAQSTELNSKLESLGVATTPLFYDQSHTPALNHEYQFDLDNADGRTALEYMVQFVEQQTTD